MSDGFRIRFLRRLTLLAIVAGLTQAALAQPAAAQRLQTRLQQILAKTPEKTDVGLLVVDCADGSTWFSQLEDRPMKPASTLKLFTSSAALERFGPNFRYETRLLLKDGELLVVGSGDPAIGDERIALRHGREHGWELDKWARALKAHGVTSLRTIALDDSIFDRQHQHGDWPIDQSVAWYQAPIGGLSLNDNCLDASFTAAGGKVTLTLMPDLPPQFYHCNLRPAEKHQPVLTRGIDQDIFEITGPVSHGDRLKPISARRPTVFFGYALQQALAKHGITLTGQVVRREIRPSDITAAKAIARHQTPMDDVLWRCNTHSQNLFAECLLKSLAAYDADGSPSGGVGSWEAGGAIRLATLQDMGLSLDGATLRDGSGLSHENRVTVRHIVDLLQLMRKHRHWTLFRDCLAQPGEDGSMRKRYITENTRGRLRGKTGTLTGVRALAGYAQRDDGHVLAFALLIEGQPTTEFVTDIADAITASETSANP